MATLLRNTNKHRRAAQKRANRREAYRLHVATGRPLDELLSEIEHRDRLLRVRDAKYKRPSRARPAPPFAKSMLPVTREALARMGPDVWRSRFKADMRYVIFDGMKRDANFNPHIAAEWKDWKHRTLEALTYKRKTMRREHRRGVLPADQLEDLLCIEITIICLRDCNAHYAAKILHSNAGRMNDDAAWEEREIARLQKELARLQLAAGAEVL